MAHSVAGRATLYLGILNVIIGVYILNSIYSTNINDVVPWMAAIPRRVGYVGEGRWGLLNERVSNPAGRPPMVAFFDALAGPRDAPMPQPVLALGAGECNRVRDSLALGTGPYWVLAPGAEYGPAKCWPAAHYAELATRLHRTDGAPVLLLGSAKEAELCESIARHASGACRVLAGRTSLAHAMALISGATGVVSNDSGLMHVAAAFGVPQVAVFGSTSPLHTPPLNPRARVIWLKQELQLDCSPCFERVCRFGHTRCLGGISAQRVELAMGEALQAAMR